MNHLLNSSKLEFGMMEHDMLKKDLEEFVYNITNEFNSLVVEKELSISTKVERLLVLCCRINRRCYNGIY
jgi:hypothetical protein